MNGTHPSENPRRSRLATRTAGLAAALAAVVTLLLFIALRVSRSYPELPFPLTLQVDFLAGHRPLPLEPLIVAGTPDHANRLEVGYLDASTAVFLYQYGDRREAISQPVTFAPGQRHRLRVQMPSLQSGPGSAPGAPATLRLHFDDREILHAQVPFRPSPTHRIYFAQNPLAGETRGTSFRGELFTATGHGLRGRPEAFSSWPQRFRVWVSSRPHEPILIILLSVLVGLAVGSRVPALAKWPGSIFASDQQPTLQRPPHRWFFVTAAFCALVFSFVITRGTFRFVAPERFAGVYDHQALAFLQGRLDLPEHALGDEAFLFEGKCYTYFGPTPALLRLPFAAFGIGVGQLSRLYMLAYYLAALTAVYALLVLAQRRLAGDHAWPRPMDVVLLIGNVGLGSTLLFLGSRAFTFHEAILCGVTFALWSNYCALRYLAEPHRCWWIAALTLGILALHARPPVGLFALALLGCVAAFIAVRNSRRMLNSRENAAVVKPLAIGALAVCGVLTFNVLSYLKFKSFEGAPLRYHVQYHPGRLAVSEGRNFHSANLGFNTVTYLWALNVTPRSTWPYLELRRPNPNFYAGARIDVAEPTLALPYAMPGLVLLMLCAIAAAFSRPETIGHPTVLVMAAAVPMTLAMFTAIAISHRYTGDFCAPLFVLAPWGLTAVALLRMSWQRHVRAVLLVLTAASIFTTLAISLS